MSLLERILAAKRARLDTLPRPAPGPLPERRPVELRRPGQLALIAEIKRRSPSAGPLSTALDPGARAAAYERAGAALVSVLCDEEFFDGAFAHLAEARRASRLPLLCKDFIIDERQLDAARAWGADAVLLIARCLPPTRLGELVHAARARDLVPLVEIATEAESGAALAAGADLIGVNARDLDTLAMDGDRAQRVLAALPSTVTRVHLSGVKSAEDVRALAASPADAALIGEALMRQDEPAPLLAALVAAARRPPARADG